MRSNANPINQADAAGSTPNSGVFVAPINFESISSLLLSHLGVGGRAEDTIRATLRRHFSESRDSSEE